MKIPSGRPLGLVLALIVLGVSEIHAQKIDIGFKKGDSVLVLIPPLLATTRYSGVSGSDKRLDFEVTQGPSGRGEVLDSNELGHPDWRSSGFPWLVPFEFRGVHSVRPMVRNKEGELVSSMT